MRILKILILVILSLSFLFAGKSSAYALNPYRSLCVGIQGTFSANSTWKGGSIQIGCAGDNGLQVPVSQRDTRACLGEVQTVRPGQVFRLTKCSCFGSDKGCLRIGKELRLEPLVDGKAKITVVKRIQDMTTFDNNSCRVTDVSNICGSNGQKIRGNVKITCAVPSPTPRSSGTPTPRPSGAPTPTACPTPGKVTNVKITCPNCFATPSPTAVPSQ